MRSSIRYYFSDATTSYEEKPREQWLFDYPAQVSLCCSQIWWTTEVNIAFSRLEEGYENALKDYQKKQVNLENQHSTNYLQKRVQPEQVGTIKFVIVMTVLSSLIFFIGLIKNIINFNF